jgi:glycosyltransferase involved in cell wall biosynthesis
MKKILFCHAGMATFVKTDFDLLSEQYDVIPYQYNLKRNKMMKVLNIFSSFYISLYWVWRVDVVYVWFGGYHGFFPVLFAKIFRKKSIVIVGGYDASYVPSIEYGVFYTKGFLLWCIKRIYNWCTWICPVDGSLVKSTNYYADPTGVGYKTGILNHVDIDEEKIKVIPTGFDEKKFNVIERGKTNILTVAKIQNLNDVILKGIDVVFAISKLFPEYIFTVVGIDQSYFDKLKNSMPDNVVLKQYVTQNELVEIFNTHKVFLQLSMTEGLPNTLCEAMLCECIPIGSAVGGVAKAIGNSGFVMTEKNINLLCTNIEVALKMDATRGKLARERIITLFPLSARIKSIRDIIES